MELLRTETYKKYSVKIYQDEDYESPRTWGCLGTMTCFHRRYNLGDKHDYRDPDQLDWEILRRDDVLSLPLYLYDHSGITMRTQPFGDRWDSGKVGYIYVTFDKIQKEFGLVNLKTKAKALRAMQAEVKVYDQYLTGDVYGYEVLAPNGEEVDSCWGYYGDTAKEGGALSAAKEFIDGQVKKNKPIARPAPVMAFVPVPIG
jgi:hypothetical protein